MECPMCKDRGVIVAHDFDGKTVLRCPACRAKDRHEQARAALAREYTSNPNRQQKRAPMRAPRSS